MKVSITHSEKSKGLLFRKKLYGVTCKVEFNEEEKEVIEKRSLKNFAIVERDIPADVDADKFENRGRGKKIATAVMKGADANHWHLTVNKLMRGPDTYHFDTYPYREQLSIPNLRYLFVFPTKPRVQTAAGHFRQAFANTKLDGRIYLADIPVQEELMTAPPPFPELFSATWELGGKIDAP